MKNNDAVTEPISPIELWIESHVFDSIKSHSEKFPYYHANIQVLERDDEKGLVKVSILIDGKGRNETTQNLTLFLVDALKQNNTNI